MKPATLPEINISEVTTPDVVTPDTPQSVLKPAIPYVRQAVHLAGDDRQAQERIVAALNEALRCDDMGLP